MPGVGLAIGVFLLILVLSKRERMLRYAYYVLLSLLIAVVGLTAWQIQNMPQKLSEGQPPCS